MKEKGFTLVELLAVIVILAIISIIAIPMIGNVIDESKKKALEVSANGLVESANYFTISNDGVYEFLFDENKKGETIKGEQLEYKGNIEGTGKLYIDKNGDISLCLVDDKYYVYKNYNSGIYIGEVKDNSCIIGYDVLTNKYVAMLDDGTGQISNVYSKEEVNNLIDSVNTNVTNNTNEITNLKGTIETLQSNLSTYALQSSLNTTNSNLDSLSSIVGNHTNSINSLQTSIIDINNNLIPTDEVTITLNRETATGTLTYQKIGKLVFVEGSITSTVSGTAVNGLFSGLPKPSKNFYVPTTVSGKYVELRTDGGLRNFADCNGTAHFSFCYICN